MENEFEARITVKGLFYYFKEEKKRHSYFQKFIHRHFINKILSWIALARNWDGVLSWEFSKENVTSIFKVLKQEHLRKKHGN